MGRWMQKIQKGADTLPTKPTKPSSVGSVGMPCPHIQEKKAANDPLTSQQVGLLTAVAELLKVGTDHLIDKGFIDRHDLAEQLDAAPAEVAKLIRSNPRWK